MWHVWRRGGCIQSLSGDIQGKRLLGIPRCRLKDNNIKMVLQEVGLGGTEWIDLTQDRDRWRAVLNAVMNLQVPTKRKAKELLASQEGLSYEGFGVSRLSRPPGTACEVRFLRHIP
jgi:hypothetical protein